MKKPDFENMELEFLIPPAGINAIVGQRSMCFAPGRYKSTDRDEQRWLFLYPGVELVSAKPLPPTVGGYDPAEHFHPTAPAVLSDCFSGGGAMNARSKKGTGEK